MLLRRWLLAQPECASASEHQRGDAVEFVCREFKPGWVQALIVFFAFMPILCFGMYLWDSLADHLALPRHGVRDVAFVLIPSLLLVCDGFATRWLFHRRALALLRDRMIWLGIPLCRHCGYDLRGQTVPRCPECGRPFEPVGRGLEKNGGDG
jgi:hypothetical protein